MEYFCSSGRRFRVLEDGKLGLSIGRHDSLYLDIDGRHNRSTSKFWIEFRDLESTTPWFEATCKGV